MPEEASRVAKALRCGDFAGSNHRIERRQGADSKQREQVSRGESIIGLPPSVVAEGVLRCVLYFPAQALRLSDDRARTEGMPRCGNARMVALIPGAIRIEGLTRPLCMKRAPACWAFSNSSSRRIAMVPIHKLVYRARQRRCDGR